MNNTSSLEQITKTGNLDSKLITRKYKIALMAKFMELKAVNPTLTQKERVKELGYSSSTLKRFRNDINMLSPYRIPPKTNKRKQNISNREHYLEGPQITSKT